MSRKSLTALRTSGLIRLVSAVGAAGRVLGLLKPAELRVEFERSPRGRALLFLSLAKVFRLQVPPDQLYDLVRQLAPPDFWRVALYSGGPPAARSLTDAGGTPGESDRVGYDYYGPRGDGALMVPYPLHPDFYAQGGYARLHKLRGDPRPIRVFFAGTVCHDAYADRFGFPMLNRGDVLRELFARYPDQCLVVRTRAELPLIATNRWPIVCVVTEQTEDTVSKHLLTPADYVRLLSRSKFALCPPGVVMPHSHNLTEALAVGTVPILPYAGDCKPPLRDRVECLSYGDAASLGVAIDAALGVSEAEACRWSRAASSYYDRNCSPEGFAARLRLTRDGGEPLRLCVNDEQHSVELSSARRGVSPGGR